MAPITLRDLLNAGVLNPSQKPLRCWQRDLLGRPKIEEDLQGLVFHSSERFEAWVLHRAGAGGHQILEMEYVPEELGRLGLGVLIGEVGRLAGEAPLVLHRAAPNEIDPAPLADLGFESGAVHIQFTTQGGLRLLS